MQQYEQILPKFRQLALKQTCILTPNLIEFKRIWQAQYPLEDPKANLPSIEHEIAFFNDHASENGRSFNKIDIYHPVVKPVAEMARSFGNSIIVRKGISDIITDGHEAYYVCEEGSFKRCGGIGDILAGTISSFQNFPRDQLEQTSAVLEL